MPALIRHDAERAVVKQYQEVESSKYRSQTRVKTEGDDRYSKSSFINSWVEQVVKESKLYSSTIENTIPHETETIPGCPNTLCSEFFSIPKTSESGEGQSISSFISKPNDTNYTLALEGYYMFSEEYHLHQELPDKARTNLWKTRPKRLDLDIPRQIQVSARRLRNASEDMANSNIGKIIFPFLSNSPDQRCVSKNVEWTEL